MAEILVGLLGPLIQIAPFVKRHFTYLCCFNSNVNSLNEEAQGLEDVKADLQQKINEAENQTLVIDSRVLSWMKKVKEIQQRKSDLDTKINRIRHGGCLSVKSRYSASREAAKIVADMKNKLEERSAITDISHSQPPAATMPDCLQTPMTEFQSRKRIEKDLIALLKDEQANMLGLWGMGGVGKTTLANNIKNKMMEENVFGESVMAIVSQPANMEKIQEDIAGQLGLKFDDHEKSLSSRATKLCIRLRCKKRILIVLDDVWEYLDLKELGIPCESGPEGCTILLTSRKRNVLEEMKVLEENVLEMQTLSKDEALSFFQEQLETSANRFPSLEQQIANECKGLPLALAIVARVLKSQHSHVWEDALGELKRSNPEDLQDVLKEVYNPLKLSYDNLSSNAQSIFLLCSLFPEDFEISLEDLTAYAMGLRMFRGIGDLETIKTKTYSLIDRLKSCALLLESRYEHVRMHDIVRDVAIFIASKEPKEMPLIRSGYNSTWISPFVSRERIELSKGSTFPNLCLLLIDKSAAEELQISGISFEGMKNLNVLSIHNDCSLTSLPLTTQNLRTLILVNCESLKTISVVGELLDLEILICRKCHVMEEIPLETLKCLKLLEISWCRALKKIGSPGHQTQHITFSKLERLILHYLPNLTVFYQGIESIEFPLLTELIIEECLKLKGLVSSPESVRMGDDGDDHSLHLLCNQKVSFGKLRKLRVQEIGNCNNIFCSSQIPVGSFTHLQELSLIRLPKLKTFCNSALWLPQLLTLHIYNCSAMRSFYSGSLTTTNMKNLESLRISSCDMMEHVFLWREEENEKTITFPKLTKLRLWLLPRLTSICKGVESIDFPLLTDMQIADCPNLTTLASADMNKLNKQTIYYSLPIWDQIPLRNFTSLESLRISAYDEISSLFSSSVAVNLINLEELIVEDCWNMVKVIEEEAEEYSHQTLFPHLELLRLFNLPELKFFCGWRCALELPLLETVKIGGWIDSNGNCDKLSSFSLGSLTTPNLKTVIIEGDEDDDVITNTQGIIDLNNVLQQRFNRKNSTLSEGQENSKKKGEIEDEEKNSTLSEGQEDSKKKCEIEEEEEEE